MHDALGRELKIGDPVIYWSYTQQIFELFYIGEQTLLKSVKEPDGRLVVRSSSSRDFCVEMNSVWLISLEEATLWILSK